MKSELRIGNYVQSLRVDSFGEDIIKFIRQIKSGSEIDNSYKFRPIPLTEEWLLKFGFELYPWGYVKNGVLISLKFRYKGVHTTIEIQYVHTLQNLFFALTGEELTIK